MEARARAESSGEKASACSSVLRMLPLANTQGPAPARDAAGAHMRSINRRASALVWSEPWAMAANSRGSAPGTPGKGAGLAHQGLKATAAFDADRQETPNKIHKGGEANHWDDNLCA